MIPWLGRDHPSESFPPVEQALREPDGLLAAGGDLSPPRLLSAYRQGIFPWYSDGQPILWWAPDPRAVLWPSRLHLSRSLSKRLRRKDFSVTIDLAFPRVIRACAAPRAQSDETWITNEMAEAYEQLHRYGFAHSIEVWDLSGELIGGLYGVALGQVFFGESMFTAAGDGSKIALAHLCTLGYALIDCQLPNEHLFRMGAELISREEFTAHLSRWCNETLAPPAVSG